jgi:HEAT repeat protein
MRFFERRKPNVKSLARAGKVEGLVEASQYRELLPGSDGFQLDVGAPIRAEAILALGEATHDGDREAIVRHLTQALTDPVDRVRCAAVMALYRLEEPGPLAEAVAKLSSDKGQARVMAIRALLALRAPGSSARLAATLLHRDDELALGETTEVVATLIDEEGTPDASRAVIELAIAALGHERSAVAFRAQELLERVGPASLDLLVEELRKRNASWRAAAVLGKMKDSRALEPLVAALEHPDPRMRSQSCVALGELRDPAAAEALLAATQDSEYEVRTRAGEALDRLGTAAIVVSIATLLRPLIQSQTSRAYPLPAATNGHAVLEGVESIEWELVLDEGAPSQAPPKGPAQGPQNQSPRQEEPGTEPSSVADRVETVGPEARVTDSNSASPLGRPRSD